MQVKCKEGGNRETKDDSENRVRTTDFFFFLSFLEENLPADERRGKPIISLTPEASEGEQFWVESKTDFSILFFPTNRGENQLDRT